MAKNVKGTIGNENVELINAATETTLAEMLAIAKQDSAVLRAMAKKADVNTDALDKVADSMGKTGGGAAAAADMLGGVAKKGSLMGGFLLDLGASAVQTAGNLANFAEELMEGSSKASDFFKAFKDIPVLGIYAGLLEKVMKYQEKNLDIYQAISGTGAGLNGSLAGLRTQASSLYLTMDELVAMYKKNGDVLQQLGGSATSGSKAFLGINQTLQRSFGPELSNLGYTFTEINDLLGGYLRVTGDGMRVNKDSATEQTRLAAAAANYGKELDYMARLTGESREATEKKMQAEAMEASWQAHLNTLEPKEREKAMMAMNRAMTIGGKGAVDALKAELMGFAVPFSEEGRTFVSMTGQAANAVSGLAKTVKDGSSVDAARTAQNKLQAAGIAGLIKDMKGFNNIVAAAGQGGAEASKGLMEMQAIVNKYNASGKVNQKQIEEEIAEVMKKTEADSKASDAANATQRRMKELGNQINLALMPIMELLATHANSLVTRFSEFLKKVDFEKLGRDMAGLMEVIGEFLEDLTSEEGRQRIGEKIGNLFKWLMTYLVEQLPSWLGGGKVEADKKRALLKEEERLIEEQRELEKKKVALKTEEHTLAVYANREAFQANSQKQQAKLKELEEIEKNRKLTDAELDERKRNQEALAFNLKEMELIKNITDEDYQIRKNELAKTKTDVSKSGQQIADDTNVNKNKQGNWQTGDTDPNWKKNQVKAAGLSHERHGGSLGATGKLIEDFSDTPIVANGREGMLTEQQMINLASGAMNTGNAQAQNNIANAILSLNKQQAMTNQLLAQSLDMHKKIADNQSDWGNRFARVA
jgi:hypothetical protein